jgi:hypothetical protein
MPPSFSWPLTDDQLLLDQVLKEVLAPSCTLEPRKTAARECD